MNHFAVIVESAGSIIVDKIYPRLCGIDKMNVHVSWHWVCLMPYPGCLIVQLCVFCETDNICDFDYSHKNNQSSTFLQYTRALRKKHFHRLLPFLVIEVIPTSISKLVGPHFDKVSIPVVHELSKVIWRIGYNTINRAIWNHFHDFQTVSRY